MTIRVQYKVFFTNNKINTCSPATKCRRSRSAELSISRAVGGGPRMTQRPTRSRHPAFWPGSRRSADARRGDAICPSARRAVAELPKLRHGRPLGAGAETKTTTDNSTSPRAVTPRAQAGANSAYLRCVLAKAQKPNRVVVIAYLRCFLSLSLFTYKFSIMYVRGLSTCVAWTLADTRPFGFCYSPAVQPPGSFLLQILCI